MTMTAIDIDTVSRIRAGEEARTLALGVYTALLSELDALDASEWDAITVCRPWTVADVVRHVVGAAKGTASTREMLRQQVNGFRRRRAHDGNALDATNALQVDDHRELTPDQLITELRSLVPLAVRWRMRRPALFDHVSVPLDGGGSTADGMPAKLNLGDLYRVVYTRDVWLHRIDIAAAVGRRPRLQPGVDGRIVEDAVREWADRHGRPFDLTLTGPLAARYVRTGNGPKLELDAVRLCWILSGRGEPESGAPGADLLTRRLVF